MFEGTRRNAGDIVMKAKSDSEEWFLAQIVDT